MSRILAVASGKGGTGKTSVSVNLALALGRMGRKVCLLDADLGLSNVDVLLGIAPEVTLEQVLFDGVPMEDAIFPAAPNLDVIPGGSGVSRLADLSREGRVALADAFATLSGYDYLLVDGSPGISSQVISLCLACPELAVVVNPDPSSITDAYALVKVLSENGMRRSPFVVMNRVRNAGEADAVFARLKAAMAKYLKLDARYLGHIPLDRHMAAAAARQRALVELFPASLAGRAVLAVARNLDEAKVPAGTDAADPAAFARVAAVRMRETSPFAGSKSQLEEVRKTLDAALDLAGLLDGSGEGAQGRAAVRLRSLLVKARSCLDMDVRKPAAVHEATGELRVAVISSDEAIGDIIAESLTSSGVTVDGMDGRATAAVVFWRDGADGLTRRLASLGDLDWVHVRGVSGRDAPKGVRPPAAVLEMPFRLEELAETVRGLARKRQAV